MTFTVPLLLKLPSRPNATLEAEPTALVSVPLLLKTLLKFTPWMGVLLLPSMLKVPALFTVLAPLRYTCEAPLIVTVRPLRLFQVLLPNSTRPVTLVLESVINRPVPLIVPPLRLLPPVTVTLPLPPNVPLLSVKGLAIVWLVLMLKVPPLTLTLPVVPRPKLVPA